MAMDVATARRSRNPEGTVGRERDDTLLLHPLQMRQIAKKPSSLSGIRGANNEETRMEFLAAARKAAGLDWMVQAPPSSMRSAEIEITSKDVQIEEVQVNPKELNPFFKDGGDGCPPESFGLHKRKRFETPVVGDGGLSWRLKALRRAKEHAEREGRRLDMALVDMTVSVLSKRAAHAHAHLHAIRDRKRMDDLKPEEKEKARLGGEDKGQYRNDIDLERITTCSVDYVTSRKIKMKAPQAMDSLSCKRRKGGSGQSMHAEDKENFHAAASALNQFQNDGTFFRGFNEKQQQQGADIKREHKPSLSKTATDEYSGQQHIERSVTSAVDLGSSKCYLSTESVSANQLAAKALQLRLRGENEEADEFLKQLQKKKNEEEELPVQCQANNESRPKHQEHHTGYNQSLKSIVGEYKHRSEKNNSGDAGLAESILHYKQYNSLTCIDDEYASISGRFEEVESMKAKRKASKDVSGKEAKKAIQAHKRIITQEERCHCCFNNPSRPKHLTISIANFTYLMLPPWEPLVDGHCLLVPTQHEGSSRNVDEDVWDELRNYKKCLLQMFAKQDKDVLFMETAINLAQQRRHCLVECIPLPPNVAKQAPLYFKKAIDEAEDEWSQHNAKKLIDSSGKGLRACIPKDFPYFHVEFGLRAGYVHVIDSEKDFETNFGRNVVIGMLKLAEEDMHRRRKQQSYDQQKKAAADFKKSWDPYDWTKMLD